METAGSTLRRFILSLKDERDHYYLSRWLFLRLLGVIYLTAFVSLWAQIEGLAGGSGILPVADFLKAVGEGFGYERFWRFPTLCWFNASDGFLYFQCAAGVAFSLLLIVGVAPVLDLIFLWAIYLSLSTVCREFLGFQWDILLLETGVLAIFVAPRQWLPRPSRETPPSVTVLWLYRWLLFRLMFMSGAVKLLSADPAWWNLAALTVHYETQPLPTWIGWYAHQMPVGFQKASVFLMFIIELVIPVLILCGRRPRQVACAAFVLFMLFISLTGNYCFFNLLTVALCLSLLDDAFFARFIPKKFATAFSKSTPLPRLPQLRVAGASALACLILLVSGVETVARLSGADNLPPSALQLLRLVSPFRSINSYGLFAVMTTTRPEIVVEGSNDGIHWLPYEFKWKPGDLRRRPAFVAPHQPRLDWQMWFAALGHYRSNPWFVNFLVRLLHGSPQVLALLQENPFPGRPPRYVRAVLYEYRFTDAATRARSGEWWRRERKGLYCPELTLRQN
jgi:uncharacterized membrane protein YphA (DoxX/SURF4 family)